MNFRSMVTVGSTAENEPLLLLVQTELNLFLA